MSRKTEQERFWAKVKKTETCWNWTASSQNGGYGKFSSDPKRSMVLAHRYSYELANGPIAEGLQIDHMCHNPACVRPAHLRATTNKQNNENRRGANRNSITGIRGVNIDKRTGQFRAVVGNWQGKTHFVGHFWTAEEAEAAVIAKRLELFTHNDADRAA